MYEREGDEVKFNLAYGCPELGTWLNDEAAFDAACSERPDDLSQALCCDRHRDLTFGTDDGVVTEAIAFGAGAQKIRVVVDELLDGRTLEQFACACALSETGNCPNTQMAALDPSFCDNDPMTALPESGRFADANLDGVPDDPLLLPGIATITCDQATTPWTNTADEGWYNPSGNQQLPVNRFGENVWDAVGPAIVLQPTALPSSSNCTLAINPTTMYTECRTADTCQQRMVDSARDKDGNPTTNPTFQFTTIQMGVEVTSPANGATGIATTTTITVAFNVGLDPASIANITVTPMGGSPVAATATLSEDGTTVEIVPDAPLAPNTQHTISVSAQVHDSFGVPFPTAGYMSVFTTGA